MAIGPDDHSKRTRKQNFKAAATGHAGKTARKSPRQRQVRTPSLPGASTPILVQDVSFDLDHIPDTQPGRVLSTPQWSPLTNPKTSSPVPSLISDRTLRTPDRSPLTEPRTPSPEADPMPLIMCPMEGVLKHVQERVHEDLIRMSARRLTPKKLQAAVLLLEMANKVDEDGANNVRLGQLNIEEELTLFEMQCQRKPGTKRVISNPRPERRRLSASQDSSPVHQKQKKAKRTILHVNDEPKSVSAPVEKAGSSRAYTKRQKATARKITAPKRRKA